MGMPLIDPPEQAAPGQVGLDAERLTSGNQTMELSQDLSPGGYLDAAGWVSLFEEPGGNRVAVQKRRDGEERGANSPSSSQPRWGPPESGLRVGSRVGKATRCRVSAPLRRSFDRCWPRGGASGSR